MLPLLLMVAALPQGTDTTFALRGATRLELSSFDGGITVTTWNRKEIRVQAEHDDDTRIDVDEGRTTLRLRAAGRGGPSEVEWTLTVPAELALQLNARSGDISVTGTRAPVSATSVDGSITLRGGSGNISLTTVEGDLRLDDASGKVALSTVDGTVSVRRLTGDLDINTVDGDITLDQVNSDNLSASTVDGSIRFAGPINAGGRYHLTSHDGNLLVMTPAIDADVSIATWEGDFESDFEVALRGGLGDRRKLTFTLGRGSARLELESFDGRIELRKGTALPARRRD